MPPLKKAIGFFEFRSAFFLCADRVSTGRIMKADISISSENERAIGVTRDSRMAEDFPHGLSVSAPGRRGVLVARFLNRYFRVVIPAASTRSRAPVAVPLGQGLCRRYCSESLTVVIGTFRAMRFISPFSTLPGPTS